MIKATGIELRGCRPQPLSAYLKALGVLRLLAEQEEPETRGWWLNEVFHIDAGMEQGELVRFFLDRYVPTPITAPWNGASGYWDTRAAHKALVSLSATTNPRLELYRRTVADAQRVVAEIGIGGKPKAKQKKDLIRKCRGRFADQAVEWLDAVVVMSDDGPRYPPILGTGGNDGNLEFTSNFIQNLLKVIDPGTSSNTETGEGRDSKARGKRSKGKGLFDRALSDRWLKDALFGGIDVALAKSAVGQFNPGGVGGPNAIGGFEGPSLVNPWDFVLMIEGALVFAGSVVWRLNGDLKGTAAFPFTVETSTAGWGSFGEGPRSARGEVWLPLWEKPALYCEVKKLFSEGRAQVGRRSARTGSDFARAAASLGVDRGMREFRRYGFLQRSGKAYLSTPLGAVRVTDDPSVRLLEQADPWLQALRRVAEDDDTAPAGIKRAFRAIEDAIFLYCERASGDRQLQPRLMQSILRAFGKAERTVGRGSPEVRKRVRPLQGLGPEWVKRCDDGSAEFRIAVSLASIHDKEAGSLRENLEPVAFKKEKGRWDWADSSLLVVPDCSDIVRAAAAILMKRLLYAEQKKREGKAPSRTDGLVLDKETGEIERLPIEGRFEASLADVNAFLAGMTDDGRILDLLWGLVAVDWQRWRRAHAPSMRKSDPFAPDDGKRISRAYALLKILFLPKGVKPGPDQEPVRIKADRAILLKLAGGEVNQAVELAARRLRSGGVVPLATRGALRHRALDFVVSSAEKRRMLASLLIPTWEEDALLQLVVAPREESGII